MMSNRLILDSIMNMLGKDICANTKTIPYMRVLMPTDEWAHVWD